MLKTKENRFTVQDEFRKYEVSVKGCNLQTGEPVSPETVIGSHYKSCELITAGFYGHIATIYFNPMNDSLLITAVADSFCSHD